MKVYCSADLLQKVMSVTVPFSRAGMYRKSAAMCSVDKGRVTDRFGYFEKIYSTGKNRMVGPMPFFGKLFLCTGGRDA